MGPMQHTSPPDEITAEHAAPVRPGLRAALRRTPKAFLEHQLTDVAAALTYYAVFSIFPGVIALVAVLSLIGHGAIDPIIASLERTPTEVSEILVGAVRHAGESRSGGLTLAIGVAAAVWSASGWIGAFGRASNRIHGVREGRPFWILRPQQLLLTLALLVLLGASALALALSGPIARQAGDILGVGQDAVRTWDLAKLPLVLALTAVVIALVMFFAPNVRLHRFRAVWTGAGLALVMWVLASTLLGYYFANFAHYNKTFGAIAGVIAFLFWLWVSNLAILFGQELNAQIARGRHRGTPPTRRAPRPPASPPDGEHASDRDPRYARRTRPRSSAG